MLQQEYIYVTTQEQLDQAWTDLYPARYVAYDLEMNGLSPYDNDILLFTFASGSGPAYIVNPNLVSPTSLLSLLSNRIIISHNSKIEFEFTLVKYGVHIDKSFDTRIAEGILTAGLLTDNGLEATIKRRLGIELGKDNQGRSFIGITPETFSPTAEQLQYAANDVSLLHELRSVQLATLKQKQMVRVAQLEFPSIPAFAQMELKGMKLDVKIHKQVLAAYIEKEKIEREIAFNELQPHYSVVAWKEYKDRERVYETYTTRISDLLAGYGKRLGKGVPDSVRNAVILLREKRGQRPKTPNQLNVRSSQQVLMALSQAGYTETVKQKDGTTKVLHALRNQDDKPSLDANVIRNYLIDHDAPILRTYQRWSKVNKVITTYGENLWEFIHPTTGRIYAEYNQLVRTGRTSSKRPNMQNMPPDIRATFVPENSNVYVIADFSNMELRITAGISKDTAMLSAFSKGIDLHQLTATKIWPEKYKDWTDVPNPSADRDIAKRGNFASLYGGSKGVLVWRGLVPDYDTAERVQYAFATLFPTARKYLDTVADNTLRVGFSTTAIGRKRYFQVPRQPEIPDDATDDESKIIVEKYFRRLAAIRREGMNHPIQGTGADIAKRAMTIVYDRLRAENIPAVLVAMVHDEFVVESWKDSAEYVAQIMSAAMLQAGREIVPNIPIPGDVKITDKWSKK